MSLIVKSVTKLFSNGFRVLSPHRNIHIGEVKYLYSSAALGLDAFHHNRRKIKEQFATHIDKFKSKMTEFVTDPKNLIFTEDLKNMVHIAEPTDLELVMNMIKKFNTQNELRFGSFVFGPVIMRMFHFLDAPNEALMSFEDPANKGLYDQLVTYQILLDLLYNHEMFDEMHRVFKEVQERQINMTKFPKYPVVLIMAACYKQNTPKSLEVASRMWSEMCSLGVVPLRRSCTFFAALALKQNAPHIALESISLQKKHYVTIRNIKATALAQMGRLDDVLPILRSVMEIDSPMQKDKHTFMEETISVIREAVDKCENKDIQKEFQDVERALRDRNLINDQTLDQLLNAEIQVKLIQDQNRNKQPFQFRKMPFGQRRHHYTETM